MSEAGGGGGGGGAPARFDAYAILESMGARIGGIVAWLSAAGWSEGRGVHPLEELAKTQIFYRRSELGNRLRAVGSENPADMRFARTADMLEAKGLEWRKQVIKIINIFQRYLKKYGAGKTTAAGNKEIITWANMLVCALIDFDKISHEKLALKATAQQLLHNPEMYADDSQTVNAEGVDVDLLPMVLRDGLTAFVQSMNDLEKDFGGSITGKSYLAVEPGAVREGANIPHVPVGRRDAAYEYLNRVCKPRDLPPRAAAASEAARAHGGLVGLGSDPGGGGGGGGGPLPDARSRLAALQDAMVAKSEENYRKGFDRTGEALGLTGRRILVTAGTVGSAAGRAASAAGRVAVRAVSPAAYAAGRAASAAWGAAGRTVGRFLPGSQRRSMSRSRSPRPRSPSRSPGGTRRRKSTSPGGTRRRRSTSRSPPGGGGGGGPNWGGAGSPKPQRGGSKTQRRRRN